MGRPIDVIISMVLALIRKIGDDVLIYKLKAMVEREMMLMMMRVSMTMSVAGSLMEVRFVYVDGASLYLL